jgi:hypothetical protein
MDTRDYCIALLDEVDRAGRDPEMAYLVRTRLRRALVGIERGRRGSGETEGLLVGAPPEITHLTKDLAARVIWLTQPSEALDVRWGREWARALEMVGVLREWLSSEATPAVN